ncbi:MAG: hypothetical protein FWH15_06620 [Betaproteobacteria bacterium]|nr:hypothetical protein [Betaproteobacteria bacterium]
MTYILENRGFGITAVVVGETDKAELSFILETGIDSIELNYAKGWQGRSFDALRGLRKIRSLALLPEEEASIEPVNSLVGLQRLYVGRAVNGELNLRSFPELHELRINFSRKLSIIWLEDAAELQCLVANLPVKYWKSLRSLPNLVDVGLIFSGKCDSLPGNTLPLALRSLSLARFSNMTSISKIEELENLRLLDMENCKKIYDFSAIKNLCKLECLTLCDCGLIRDLKFSARLQNLRALTLNGDSLVEDGNLDNILKLPKLEYLAIVAKQHYSLGHAELHKGDNLADLRENIKAW